METTITYAYLPYLMGYARGEVSSTINSLKVAPLGLDRDIDDAAKEILDAIIPTLAKGMYDGDVDLLDNNLDAEITKMVVSKTKMIAQQVIYDRQHFNETGLSIFAAQRDKLINTMEMLIEHQKGHDDVIKVLLEFCISKMTLDDQYRCMAYSFWVMMFIAFYTIRIENMKQVEPLPENVFNFPGLTE